VPFAFRVLDRVAQGDFTKWRIVYDLTEKKVFFSTLEFRPRRQVQLADLNFDCSAPPLAFDLSSPIKQPRFERLTAARNLKLIQGSVSASEGRIEVTQKSILRAAEQFASVVCK
jgi:choloylglycine hydrolase